MAKKTFGAGITSKGVLNNDGGNKLKEVQAKAEYNFQFIDKSKIKSNPKNEMYTQEGIEALMESIKINGLRHNLSVIYDTDNDVYRLVSGERRFRAICMMSDKEYKELFPSGIPCKVEKSNISDMKEKMGYQGLILTDCMEMLAIQDHYGTPEGTVAAIKAGVDLAEISSTIGLEWAAAKAVNEAAQQGELDMEEIKASVEKILRYKGQIRLDLDIDHCNLEEDRLAAQTMTRQAITCCSGTAPLAGEKTFFCGCADYRASGAANESGSTRTFVAHMGQAFGAPGMVTSHTPEAAEIEEAARLAAQQEQIILCTCNAHLFQGQLALAEALAATGKPLTVVALRNPYDIPLLPDCQCKIAAYDYSIPSLIALEEVFRGGEMTGTLPVKL